MNPDLLSLLAGEIAKLLQPIRDVIENPRLLPRLLTDLGAEADMAGGDALVNAFAAVAALADDVDQLASQPSPSFAGIEAVLASGEKAFDAIRALSNAGGPAEQIENFGRDLIDFLVAAYLMTWQPVMREVAALLTLIEPAEEQDLQPGLVVGDKVVRLPYRIDRFHLGRISNLLSDPVGTLRAAYVNDLLTVADANAMADKLFPRLLGVLRSLGVPCRCGFRPGDEPLLGDVAPLVDHALIIWVVDALAGVGVGAGAEAGGVFTLSSADRGDLGFLASPFGELQLQTQAGAWAIELDVSAGVEGVAYGRHGVTLLASPSTAGIDGKISATLAAPKDGPAFILGASTGTRLEIGGAEIKVTAALSEAAQTLAISGNVSKSAIVIARGDGDGFISSILPSDGMRAEFDLGLAWSNKTGLSFRGGTGLEATLPINPSPASSRCRART
jgi:hypothetical protein